MAAQELNSEQRDLITEIETAFNEVSRDGGVSWTECDALDGYASLEDCTIARASDRDTHWNQLIDDPDWQPFPGCGGFSFIDAIGFRYYLPPTMIRFVRGEQSEWFDGHLLGVIERQVPEWSSLLTIDMKRCISRFIEYMSRHDQVVFQGDPNPWLEALENSWRKHLRTE